MSAEKAKLGFLSNNMLKLIAAALMVCDHAGMLLFPEVPIAVDAACCAGVTAESHNTALAAMRAVQIEIL